MLASSGDPQKRNCVPWRGSFKIAYLAPYKNSYGLLQLAKVNHQITQLLAIKCCQVGHQYTGLERLGMRHPGFEISTVFGNEFAPIMRRLPM